jgi:hypothetical protein
VRPGRRCWAAQDLGDRYDLGLRQMIDRDLLHYVFDQLDVFVAACETALRDVHEGRFALTDTDKYDEYRQHIRSSVVAVTSAFHIHQTQTYWLCKEKFGEPSDEYTALTKLFHGLTTAASAIAGFWNFAT